MSTEYYRSDDPIENFVLKVVVQEVNNASNSFGYYHHNK